MIASIDSEVAQLQEQKIMLLETIIEGECELDVLCDVSSVGELDVRAIIEIQHELESLWMDYIWCCNRLKKLGSC